MKHEWLGLWRWLGSHARRIHIRLSQRRLPTLYIDDAVCSATPCASSSRTVPTALAGCAGCGGFDGARSSLLRSALASSLAAQMEKVAIGFLCTRCTSACCTRTSNVATSSVRSLWDACGCVVGGGFGGTQDVEGGGGGDVLRFLCFGSGRTSMSDLRFGFDSDTSLRFRFRLPCFLLFLFAFWREDVFDALTGAAEGSGNVSKMDF